MRSFTAKLCGVFLCALLTNDARADLVHWSYSWSASPSEVMADSPGTGMIILSDAPLQNVVGDSYIVATNLITSSTASASQPDVFTNVPYTLNLTILDQSSGQSGTATFGEEFNGTLTANSANITSTPTTPTSAFLVLGNYLYTATLASFVPPGPPDSSNSGSISSLVSVTVTMLPEPNSLIMGGFGLFLVALVCVWNRQHFPFQPA